MELMSHMELLSRMSLRGTTVTHVTTVTHGTTVTEEGNMVDSNQRNGIQRTGTGWTALKGMGMGYRKMNGVESHQRNWIQRTGMGTQRNGIQKYEWGGDLEPSEELDTEEGGGVDSTIKLEEWDTCSSPREHTRSASFCGIYQLST